MSFRKESYKDVEKWRKATRDYKRRYYGRTAFAKNHMKPWREDEDEIVLAHETTDRQIAERLGRSVKAIQIRRSRLTREG